VAFFVNSRLVMRFGMVRLSVAALILLFLTSALLTAIARNGGIPPFLAFMGCCSVMFMCFGILLGNLNAMAMDVLGRVAGLGTSIVASVSTMTAVVFAVSAGRFYDGTAVPMGVGFILASIVALVLVLAATRSNAEDI
jgi:DHA1 family bicyclomycin/chloramphenicol resistance-like MFS transporter